MLKKNKKLVIFGTKAYAEIVYEYFKHDSTYEVCAFTAEEAYIEENQFCGLPVVPFEQLEIHYPPDKYELHIAVVYNQLNRIRERFYFAAKNKGYKLATYISSHSFVWHNVKIGDNCFVFEDNTLQPFVEINNNIILWSGNHIGHSSVIQNHCFISSHVVISGFCNIGNNCFIGVNSTVGNHASIGSDSWISPGAIIIGDIPAHSLVKGAKSEYSELNEKLLFRKLSTISS